VEQRIGYSVDIYIETWMSKILNTIKYYDKGRRDGFLSRPMVLCLALQVCPSNHTHAVHPKHNVGDWNNVLLIQDTTKLTESPTITLDLDKRALGISWLTLDCSRSLAVLSENKTLFVFFENRSEKYKYSSVAVQHHYLGDPEIMEPTTKLKGCVACTSGLLASAVGNTGWVWTVEYGKGEPPVPGDICSNTGWHPEPVCMFDFGNMASKRSHISQLSFVSQGSRLLVFFCKERYM
jgi:hypothetical protein